MKGQARYKRSPKEDRTHLGRVFDSKREMKRAVELVMLQERGQIEGLEMQVPFVVAEKTQKGERDMVWRADFVYYDSGGFKHVEDSKGHRTQLFLLKRRLVFLKYGIRIEET